MTSPAALVQQGLELRPCAARRRRVVGDYVEQITCLLFLKMDEERADLLGEPSRIPAQ